MTDPGKSDIAGVDVGGTFTDALVVGPDGPRLAKVPTTPDDQGRGLLAALDAAGSSSPDAVAHGTTTATNAVLERRLDRAALLVTEGFADLLQIGRQNRPSLYDLRQVASPPAIGRDMVVPVAERVTVGGQVLTPMADEEVQRVVARLQILNPSAVAICLLFSWANPDHEDRLAAAIRTAMPDVHLTRSHDLVGSIREYERASTCALNAAVGPLMHRYLSRLADHVPHSVLTVMTSAGGTADAGRMADEPVHTLLSGPAAGVVAAAAAATAAGLPDALAFDMGGTSTDVCLINDGRPARTINGQIGGLPIGTATVAIHTVGAGGGSIATLDAGGALQVGPQSAGAEPGPACYGRGGTRPTVTDAHAVLGHLDTLAGGAMVPDVAAAEAALARVEGATARGILDVVRASMARALRKVSTEAGVDPAGLALIAYGGAGPLHASALARELGCPATVLPPAPGVLSAVGLVTAPARQEHARTVMTTIEGVVEAAADLRQAVADRAAARGPGRVQAAGGVPSPGGRGLHPSAADSTTATPAGHTTHLAADLRYQGQAHELRVSLDPVDGLAERFHQRHHDVYGYRLADRPIEVVTIRLIQTGPPLVTPDQLVGWDLGPADLPATRTADLGDGPEDVQVIARGSLSPGDAIQGPAILTQPDSTALLLAGDVGTVTDDLSIVVRHG